MIKGDGQDYNILSEAVSYIKDVEGLTCEIGVREGFGSYTIMKDLSNTNQNKIHIAIDPYGNIYYYHKENTFIKQDYTNNMRNQCMIDLYKIAQEININFLFFPLEDTEFMKKYKEGIPVYEQEKQIINKYALVYFDGPHNFDAIVNEFLFFNERSDIGSVFVFDDIEDYYDHTSLEHNYLIPNGWELLNKAKTKASYIKRRDNYLSKVRKHFTPESVLDIGANIGQFYLQCKTVFPNAYYFLIEGNSNCTKYLQNLGIDFLGGILLSDKYKDVYFYSRKENPICTGSSIYREDTEFYKDEAVTVTKESAFTLDSLGFEETFDLIKIDTQGSELDILKGGVETIIKAKGIIIEISNVEYNLGSPKEEEIISFLENIGFKYTEVLDDTFSTIMNRVIYSDVLFLNKGIYNDENR